MHRLILNSVVTILIALGCGAGVAALVGFTSVSAVAIQASADAAVTALPDSESSLKFVVLGDFGTGQPSQYELAAEMAKLHDVFEFDLAITVGDNLYGSERPQDFKKKFETPYKPLLDAGVKFYASLGNHDAREQRYYKLFNMDGKLYYSFKASAESVRFFILDSTYPAPEQLHWLEGELKGSNDDWKIAVFHHPLYSSSKRHGSDLKLREVLEPLFVRYGVSVALTGHDHVYERIKPQHGIVYFVVGSGGQLRPGNLNKPSVLTARGFDAGPTFLAVEISGDTLSFNAISSTGIVVDSGTIARRQPAGAVR